MHYLSALIYRPNCPISSIAITEKIIFIDRYRYGGQYIMHPYSEFIVVLKFKIILNFFSATLQKPNGKVHGFLLRDPGQCKRLGRSTKVEKQVDFVFAFLHYIPDM